MIRDLVQRLDRACPADVMPLDYYGQRALMLGISLSTYLAVLLCAATPKLVALVIFVAVVIFVLNSTYGFVRARVQLGRIGFLFHAGGMFGLLAAIVLRLFGAADGLPPAAILLPAALLLPDLVRRFLALWNYEGSSLDAAKILPVDQEP